MKGTEHQTDKRAEDIAFKSQDPFSLLILGVDERKNVNIFLDSTFIC